MALLLLRSVSLLLSVIISASLAVRFECDQRNVSCGCGFKNVDINDGMFRLEEAVPHSWSMIASIQYDCQHRSRPSTHCCTGTILNDRYILTSASCFDRKMNKADLADEVTIVAGIHSLNQQCAVKQKVESIQIHPEWTGERNDSHDLALIRLATRLDFTNDFLLSRTCRRSSSVLSNTTLAVVGWNVSDDFDPEKNDAVRQMAFYSDNLDTTDTLWHLRWPTAPCFQENGTALFQWSGDRWELIGVQAFAMNICSTNDYHGVFTPIAAFSNWMDSALNVNQTTTAPTTTRATTTGSSFFTYPCNRSFSCGCSYSNVRFTTADSEQIEHAASNSWSMVVSLRSKQTNEHLCTGTLLSTTFVLTTAQCAQLVPMANLSVFAGATNLSDTFGYRRNVKQILNHTHTELSPNIVHNVALLQLDRALIFKDNPNLNRICIENPNKSLPLNELTPIDGSQIVAVGWDSIRTRNTSQAVLGLEQLHMYVQDHHNADCAMERNSTSSQFCAGQSPTINSDTCLNDPGLAIFNWTGHYWQQVGISANHFNCSRPGQPNPYTRLSYYWPWIETILNSYNETLDPGVFVPPTTTTTVTTIRTTRTTITTTNTDDNIWNTTATPLSSNTSVTSNETGAFTTTTTFSVPTNTSATNSNSTVLTTLTPWTNTSSSGPMNTTQTFNNGTWTPTNTSQPNNSSTVFTTSTSSTPFNSSQTNPNSSMWTTTSSSWTPSNSSQTNPNSSMWTTTSSSWTPSNTTQTNNNSSSTWAPFNSSQTMTNVSGMTTTLSTSTSLLNNVTGSNGTLVTSSPTRPATSTTTSKPAETWYVCNRLPDQCGCSLNDVILTDGNEGTENIRPRSWSMIVSVRSSGGQHLCTGTILSDFYILTSARCVSNLPANMNLQVVAGIDDLWANVTSVRQVAQLVIHENYNGNVSSLHDIALLKLSSALDMNRQPLFSISKICLPNSDAFDSMESGRLMTVGWKHLPFPETHLLQQVPVNMVNRPNSMCFNSSYTNTLQFCAGVANQVENTCTGHFGEPVFIYRNKFWEQVGILSEVQQCRQMAHSGVFTRLSAHLDWIRRKMADAPVPTRQTPISASTTIYTQSIAFLFPLVLLTIQLLS